MRLSTLILLFIIFYCKINQQVEQVEDPYIWISKTVKASAYNSVTNQTNTNPVLTAFGDELQPGQKYIAVSRDLLKNELKYNTLVKIEGLEGNYIVKDKMHSRWKNHIDIYMGLDVEAAIQWGRRTVCIEYAVEKEE
ncbi:hypothetical protein Q4566_04875 [Tamlana sp. 2_MG-2023]|uniref:3D domain-containing protein n=1 Tax=unclassified Tamlana TaxID=2614803 RepID=UPI0026E304D6|nr:MULTISPECIES: hypothetical protein [unclassified Tamlana]MDO6759526.1 hypothetical protein [Tamlana sp. 2_MG-2023]MDO6790335.1 hypothetical protein [Tamlana sp. 1_MG-2023]